MIACCIGLSMQEVIQVFVQSLVVGNGDISEGLLWISSHKLWVRVVAMSFPLWSIIKTRIMHQHANFADLVDVLVVDFDIIDRLRDS
jgi:hypothetical protein